MDAQRHLFYAPESVHGKEDTTAICGDFMPFYWEGTFHLFFLHKQCIYKTTTNDFVHYTHCRIAIPNSTPEDLDWHVATGGACRVNGRFYLYYTGFNDVGCNTAAYSPQVILRAVSDDLEHWEKDKEFCIRPLDDLYGREHWRDPQVFWDPDENRYCMAVTGSHKDGLHNKNGCSIIFVSDNGLDWTHTGSVYSPGLFVTHECHDFFKIGEWWYVVFSNYTRWWETRYRMAKSIRGPWLTPEEDMLDGRAVYAAKTVSDGVKRYFIGWISQKTGKTDLGKYIWGGNTLVHEVVQREDGTLAVLPVETMVNSFDQLVPQHASPMRGAWEPRDANAYIGRERYGFAWLDLGAMPGEYMITLDIRFAPGTTACGVLLHTQGDLLEDWCSLRLEPFMNQILFDRSNRFNLDNSFIESRRMSLDANAPITVKIMVSGSVIVSYVNDMALSARAYDYKEGSVGLFVENGEATFDNIQIHSLSPDTQYGKEKV